MMSLFVKPTSINKSLEILLIKVILQVNDLYSKAGQCACIFMSDFLQLFVLCKSILKLT